MFSTRWIKLLRDIQLTPWRIAFMLLAIAIGVFGFTTMLSNYTLLAREVSRNYLATNPASASLQIDNIDSDLLAGARHFPGIMQVQANATLNADIYFTDGTIHPLIIFVIDDFNQLKINTISTEAGAWPPLPNTVLLERSSLAQVKINIGDVIKIRLNDGSVRSLNISGTAHDPAVPVPSMAAFAYASPTTLKSLGVDVALSELKITVSDKNLAKSFEGDTIEQTASQLAHWIEQQGHKVSRIRIPPPGEHPHQRIIFSVSGVFLLFSGIALLLSSVLTATIIDGFMAQQVRQIGVMKTIGASTVQIAGLYLTFVLILSTFATVLGVSAGLTAGRALSKMILANLNFNLQSSALPYSIYFALIAAGALLPLCMAAIPIIKSTRLSIQSALTYVGTARQHFVMHQYFSVLYRLPGIDRSLVMALRNSFRRRGRLMLIITLLSGAGAMFMSSLNLKKASQQHLIAAAAERHYDFEISLNQAEDQQKIRTIIKSIDGVNLVEAWSSTTLARHRPDGINIEKTFTDGGHGAIYLTAIPPGSQLLSIKMQRGHWLNSTDENTVVINHKALEAFPHAGIDDEITIDAAGNARTLKIVGIADQKMTSGTAYVSASTYAKITGQDERYKNYRVVMKQHDEIFIEIATKKIEAALAEQHIKINNVLTESRLRHEVDGHFTMLINALLFITILMAVVGIFGLGSVMSIHVTERTREFGIMRSIGASSKTIIRNIAAESLCISITSWILAIALSLPLSVYTSDFLGKLIFDEAFPLSLSLTALWIWLLIVIAGSTLASIYPAKKAISISIRESFTF